MRAGRRLLCRAGASAVRAGSEQLGLLSASLDRAVIGHQDAKEAVVLALAAREHVYMEGPPGTAKTMLAEVAARAAGLSRFVYQLHRDTRVSDLLGDAVIKRESDGDGGEIIRQGTLPGGVLSSGVCVLDDISRAPGEALNVLLRILAEREWDGVGKLPLVTAIATGNPAEGADYANEPLDPAHLDRFCLQVKAEGLLAGQMAADARTVIDLYDGVDTEPEHSIVDLDVVHGALAAVVIPDAVKERLLQVLMHVSSLFARSPPTAGTVYVGLTDRTFLVKAPRVIRARALRHGRDECTEEDLQALRLMTTCRLPPHVHEAMVEAVCGQQRGSAAPQPV